MARQSFWNDSIRRENAAERLISWMDKRLFRWNNLPSLSRLRFVQYSYGLIFVLPIADRLLSPLVHSGGLFIGVDLGQVTPRWIVVSPATFEINIGIPFSWKLIYLLTLFMAAGSVIYEISRPRALGIDSDAATLQKVKQNFREVAAGIFTARRRNHFINDFLRRYVVNEKTLRTVSKQAKNKAGASGHTLIPMQAANSTQKPNRYSIYYAAERMDFREDLYNEALETLAWYANEAYAIRRWLSGLAFVTAISIFIVLVVQGLMQILF